MVIFNKKWKKYNEIQLTKNIMDLNIRKMTNHPPSPVQKYALILVKMSPKYTVTRIRIYIYVYIDNIENIYCHSLSIQYNVICLQNVCKINFYLHIYTHFVLPDPLLIVVHENV